MPGARSSLALLLSINLFNYIDRQILAAVEPNIRETFFSPGDQNAMAMTGILATAFLVSYMLSAPLLGALADRFSRWTIVGVAVILWSLASGGSGLAATFGLLVATRIEGGKRLRQHPHVCRREVQALCAGRRHDVRGVAGEE